jgi:hypothetical protein
MTILPSGNDFWNRCVEIYNAAVSASTREASRQVGVQQQVNPSAQHPQCINFQQVNWIQAPCVTMSTFTEFAYMRSSANQQQDMQQESQEHRINNLIRITCSRQSTIQNMGGPGGPNSTSMYLQCAQHVRDQWSYCQNISSRPGVPGSVMLSCMQSRLRESYDRPSQEDIRTAFEDTLDMNTFCANRGETFDPSSNTCVPGSSANIGEGRQTTTRCTVSGGLGWVICPVIEIASWVMDMMYRWIETTFLQISPQLFNTDNGTFRAWEIFRNMANVLFVIFFLLVILSQVTGFGISNYGIKKALPRLIIVAILVNLSYFICMIFVDISNILGSQLRSLLQGIGEGVRLYGTNGDLESDGGFLSWMVVAGLATAGVVAGVGALGSLGLPGIALGIITGGIALAFMLVLLMIRQVAVILLVVMSPLAFAMYILPNTEKLFRKWLMLFKVMLVMYPIVGLVIGAGLLASRIVLSTTADPIMQTVAVSLQVVPFFAVPALIKMSLAGLGVIGQRVSGIADRGYKYGSDKAKGSTLGQMSNQYKQGHAIKKAQGQTPTGKAGAYIAKSKPGQAIGKYGAKFSGTGPGKLLAGAGLSTAAYQDARNAKKAAAIGAESKVEKEQLDNMITMINKDTRGGDLGMLENRYATAAKSGNIQELRAITEIAGQDKFKAARVSRLMKEGDVSRGIDALSGDARSAVAKQMTTGSGSKAYRTGDAAGYQYAADVNGGGDVGNYGSWAGTAGADGKTGLQKAYGNFINSGSDAYSQSSGTLREFSEAGLISEDKAKEYKKYAQDSGSYDDSKDAAMGLLDVSANSTTQIDTPPPAVDSAPSTHDRIKKRAESFSTGDTTGDWERAKSEIRHELTNERAKSFSTGDELADWHKAESEIIQENPDLGQ